MFCSKEAPGENLIYDTALPQSGGPEGYNNILGVGGDEAPAGNIAKNILTQST